MPFSTVTSSFPHYLLSVSFSGFYCLPAAKLSPLMKIHKLCDVGEPVINFIAEYVSVKNGIQISEVRKKMNISETCIIVKFNYDDI